MQQEYFIHENERFVRVNKTKAHKVYAAGGAVYLIQNRMRVNNPWQGPCPISKSSGSDDRDFDAWVNEFMYYNCDSERGRKVKYFVSHSYL